MVRLYRAKGQTNDKWYKGYLIKTRGEAICTIRTRNKNDYICYLSTLGQSTGLFDKNGVEIFEGDIVKGAFYGIPVPVDNYVFKIQWSEANAGFQASAFDSELCEVIGNIYDNPELSEVE